MSSAVTEQLVYLRLTIAQGLTFISLGVAILFASFKQTEVIARSIVDLRNTLRSSLAGVLAADARFTRPKDRLCPVNHL